MAILAPLQNQQVAVIPQPVPQQNVVYAPYTPSNPNPQSPLLTRGVQQQPQQPSIGINPITSAPRLLGTVNGVGSAINNFGAANFGTANVPTSFVGPLQPGITSGTTLTGLAQGAGVGYLAGTLNPWAKNKTNSQIGGVAGGLAGAAALGGMSGVTMGATLGSIVPGIGTVIGAAAGALLGGFLGPGKPKPGASFEGILDNDYNYTNSSTLAKHMGKEGVTAISQEMSPYLKNLQANGIKIPEGTSVGTYIEKDGNGVLFYRSLDERTADTKTNKINFNPNDDKDRARAYNELSMQLAKQGGATPEQMQALAANAQQQQMSGGVAAPQVAVKDLNPNMANNNWDNFMKSYNARNT
jgi:hypothetical protein